MREYQDVYRFLQDDSERFPLDDSRSLASLLDELDTDGESGTQITEDGWQESEVTH